MPQRITEARRSLPAEAAQASSGQLRIQLMDAGWGSSGYYSAEMLARDGAAAFPAGTHMYFDHAGTWEAQDHQGIRSVRDLAAVTTSAAEYNASTKALEADVQILAPYRDLITELAPHVGLSITGEAVAETGEADGRTGPLITELVQGYSVDFVSHAGRGGRVLSLLESARRPVHTREAYGLTANDLRSLLYDAVGATYGGADVWTYIADYTDAGTNDWLVFNRDNSDADGTFQVGYSVTDGEVSFVGDPVEVYVHTQYLPVGTTPPAQPVPIPTQEASNMPEIDEAELRQLRETAGTVQAAEQRATAAEQRATEAERQRDLLTAAGVARGKLDKALSEGDAAQLPAAVHERIRASVTRELPLSEKGELDGDKFDQAVVEAVKAERDFVAKIAEQMGAGSVRGLGGGTTPGDGEELTKAKDKLAEALQGLGMDEKAAAVAAQGRR